MAAPGFGMDFMELRSGQGSFISDAPRWFIIVLGLAYATGFVIVSTFLDSFGVHDATSELLRLKYLQVGFFFLLSLGSVIILTTTLARARQLHREALASSAQQPPAGATTNVRSRAEERQEAFQKLTLRMMTQQIAIWTNVLIVIYLVVGFAHPQAAQQVLPPVTILLVLALGGSILIYRFGLRFGPNNPDVPLLVGALTWSLFALIVLVDVWVIWSFKGRLLVLVKTQTLVLIVMSLLLVVLWYLAYRGAQRRDEMRDDVHRTYMWARVALWLAIYYLCILSFSHGVYPFMSASRGGGYYPDSQLVILTLRAVSGHCPEKFNLVDNVCRSKEMVLIEENSNSAFVADPTEPNRNDCQGGMKSWTNTDCRPRVFEIRLPEILGLEHVPQ
jgi:hypothetical protein